MRSVSYRGALRLLGVGLILASFVVSLMAELRGLALAQSLPFTPIPGPTTTLVAPSPSAASRTIEPTRSTPTPSATNSATATSPASASPRPGMVPDQCEENDSLTQPCAIPANTTMMNLNFVDDAIDVFSVLLKGGRSYTIQTLAGDSGIDPTIRLFLATDTNLVVAENDDMTVHGSDALVTVNVSADAWYLIEVRNMASGSMLDRVYGISIRSDALISPSAMPQPTADANQARTGDVYENNWSPETAGTLVWGVPYDLSLICPDLGACASGDHDFFWVPVKAGVSMSVVTYDLGPGADPVLTLYRPTVNYTDPATGMVGWQAWASNDDVVAGFTLRAQLLVTPDWSGYALLVVSSSQRRDPPPLPPAAGPIGRYRLIVGPPSLGPVATVLAAQTDIPPAPTATATVFVPSSVPVNPPVSAPPAPQDSGDSREVIRQESVSGIAVVVKETTLFAAAPPTEHDAIRRYPVEAQVRLLGYTYLGWVKVRPLDSVTDGFMWAGDLIPLDQGSAAAAPRDGAASEVPSGVPTSTGGGPSDAPPAVGSGRAPGLHLQVLPTLTPPAAPLPAPVARTLTVEVCTRGTRRDPPDRCGRPLPNLRVELLAGATQSPVARPGTTDRDGRVTLSVSVPAQTALLVQIPALGVQTWVDSRATTVAVRIPSSSGGANE